MPSKWRLILRVIHGMVGAMAGVCGCVVFAKTYNTNAAIWAAISASIALWYIYIILSVHRDVEQSMKSQCFLIYMVLGSALTITGLAIMVSYLAIGLSHKEDLHPSGSYVVIVWGFMTFKWALLVVLSSWKFRRLYKLTEDVVVSINE